MSGSSQRLLPTVACAARNFHRDKCLDLSATVAFYSLLSLAPALYLVSLTLSRLFELEGPIEVAVQQVSGYLPRALVPSVHSLTESLESGQGLVLLALPGLFWVATSSLSALEYAINVAFATAGQRKFWHARFKALVVLGAGWLLVILSLLGSAVLPRLARAGHWLDPGSRSVALSAAGSSVLILLSSFLSFICFYKLLPRGRVSWRASAFGALLALVLWETARRLFAMLIARSPTLGLLTGTLAGVVAFLLWIYTAVAITLLGAELAAILNGNRPGSEPNR